MNCVGIGHAMQFCAWKGKRLPTEWEWEWIARGGEAARRYPWGSAEPTCELAVMGHSGFDGTWAGCERNSTWPVASRPRGASIQGIFDLAGNVREFVLDQRLGQFNTRGGSFIDWIEQHLEVFWRISPADLSDSFPYSGTSTEAGFRCVDSESGVRQIE
jgi:formylglycine-generating enzyme required for sulfatase activity